MVGDVMSVADGYTVTLYAFVLSDFYKRSLLVSTCAVSMAGA